MVLLIIDEVGLSRLMSFGVDGETSHCGIDVFDFVKIDGQWLVSDSMWTGEPEACAEVRPADTSNLRPRN